LPLYSMNKTPAVSKPGAAPATPDPQLQSSRAPPQPPGKAVSTQPQIDQTAIATLVDRFLAARKPQDAIAQTDDAALRESAPATTNQIQATAPASAPPSSPPPSPSPPSSPPVDKSESNGRRAVDFVCEEDVKRAIAKGDKIYINAKTILTPSARDLGEQREVFAKTG